MAKEIQRRELQDEELAVSATAGGQVAIRLDKERTGEIYFTPTAARRLAAILARKADDAEQTTPAEEGTSGLGTGKKKKH